MRCFYCPAPGKYHNDLLSLLPAEVTVISPEEAAKIALDPECTLFWEFPENIPGLSTKPAEPAGFLRAVAVSSCFGETLPPGRILMPHDFEFIPVTDPVESLVTLAKVAGYRQAEFGIPENSYPMLFRHPQNPGCLISTIRISNFASGRFSVQVDWRELINWIFAEITGKDAVMDFSSVVCSVNPAYQEKDILPDDAEEKAFQKSVRWFCDQAVTRKDGREYIIEGFTSLIHPDGSQKKTELLRGDCNGEAALIYALAHANALPEAPEALEHCRNVLDSLYRGPLLCDHDVKSATYGSTFFSDTRHAVYGDDNARGAFGALLYTELTGDESFMPEIMRQILSVYRTTGTLGLRGCCLEHPAIDDRTWQSFFEEETTVCRPHYQATAWALNLQAYVMTGFDGFLTKAESAIHQAMDKHFPDFLWTNGITQEWGRMLLPLAMLVEVRDTPENRAMLRRAAVPLLEKMENCGAIREAVGAIGKGLYPAPESNDDYGKAEAALVHKNGDPLCDLLYTIPYAFAGLHEAACATGEKIFIDAADKMADFVCRVQAKSGIHPGLDGCWLRGFDYRLWEYAGNPADPFWGAWCVESGWTNAWIGATLGLRLLNRSFLCRNLAGCAGKLFPEIYRQMMQ